MTLFKIWILFNIIFVLIIIFSFISSSYHPIVTSILPTKRQVFLHFQKNFLMEIKIQSLACTFTRGEKEKKMFYCLSQSWDEGFFLGTFLNLTPLVNLIHIIKNYISIRLNYQIITYLLGFCEFKILQLSII